MTNTEIMAIVGGLLIGYRMVGKFVGRKHDKSAASDHENRSTNTEQQNSYSQENQEPCSDKGDSHANDQASRVFACSTCHQKIRVTLPLPNGVEKCSKCNTRFHIYMDDEGNLYIKNATNENDEKNEQSVINSVKDCFTILELGENASSNEIKIAYRRKMMEYHPDKVASLGSKLKAIADGESKKLNSAYTILKKRGFIGD